MDHLTQIQRAIDYIEDHLHGDLEVDTIAKVAGFSRWHFQIVFGASAGLSLKDYIRQRRLTKSLSDLKSGQRILDIALEAGFESQESFTRAFKTMFKMTPGECKKTGHYPTHIKRLKITMDYLDHLYAGVTMEPKFVQLNEMKIIGMAGTFISVLSPEKDNMIVIPKLWQSYMPRRHEIKNVKSPIDLGVCMEVPANRKTRQDECLYFACTEVTSLDDIPNGMEGYTIPAGEYAVFTHKGVLETFEHTMNYIYGSWLPKSGKKLRHAPDLEMYDHRFKLNHPDSEIDVYIPIE